MAINMRHGSVVNYAMLKAHVGKAHHREKMASQEWKYMISKLADDEFYVRRCAMYGYVCSHLYYVCSHLYGSRLKAQGTLFVKRLGQIH